MINNPKILKTKTKQKKTFSLQTIILKKYIVFPTDNNAKKIQVFPTDNK